MPHLTATAPVRFDCGPITPGYALMMEGPPSSSDSAIPRGSELNLLKWVVKMDVDLAVMDRDRRREMRPLDADDMWKMELGFKGFKERRRERGS